MIATSYAVLCVLAVSLPIGFLAGVVFQRRRQPPGWTYDDGEWFPSDD